MTSDKPIQLGLERIRSVCKRMELLTPTATVITVAGTNGKGSTVAFLESFLLAGNKRVGSFTSPHLFEFNERIRINGKPVDDALIVKALEAVKAALIEEHLTYFEWVTVAALYIFKMIKLDVVVLEVGMGGRLDATNVVDPDLSIITSIGIDHEAYLGDTREKIGFEKAGIFRDNKPVVCGDLNPPQSLLEHAKSLNCKLERIGLDYKTVHHQENWDYESEAAHYKGLPYPLLRIDNAASAITALISLGLCPDIAALKQALQNIYLPGRLEFVQGDVAHLYDVAHNPHAMSGVIERIKAWAGEVVCVFGMFKDKRAPQCINGLAPYVREWHVGPVESERSLSERELTNVFFDAGLERQCVVYGTIEAAYVAAKVAAKPGSLLLVTGSFLTVSAVKSCQNLTQQDEMLSSTA